MPVENQPTETEQPDETLLPDGAADATEQPSSGSPMPEGSDGSVGGTDAADPAPEDPAPSEPQVPAWQSQLQEVGFSEVADAESAVERLVAKLRIQEEQLSNYNEQVRFYRENRQPAQPHQVDAPQEPSQDLDQLTKLAQEWEDPSWSYEYLTTDEEGNRLVADGTPDDIRKKIHEMDRRMTNWNKTIQSPAAFREVLDAYIDHKLNEGFETSYQQKQTQAQEQSAVDTFVNENANWLYRRDPVSGNFLQDHGTGDYLYSDQGTRFIQLMQQFAEDGVSSISRQLHYAKQVMGVGGTSEPAPTGTQPTQKATPTAADRRREMRGKTNTAKGRQREFNGVSPDSGSDPTGGGSLSFAERTVALMSQGGEE